MTQAAGGGDVVTVSLFRFEGRANRHWAWWQMLLSRWALRRLPGQRFMRQCGAGSAEGFSPLPDFGVYALLASWTDMEAARAQTERSAPYAAYRRRAAQSVTVYLRPTRVRGAWGGGAPFAAAAQDDGGDLAVLTRATIRPSRLWRFWRRTPGIRADIPDGRGLALKIGLGDIPWMSQITFSVWRDRAALQRFAWDPDSPHGRAVAAARAEDYFSEQLFARFRVAAVSGAWPGYAPSAPHPAEVAA